MQPRDLILCLTLSVFTLPAAAEEAAEKAPQEPATAATPAQETAPVPLPEPRWRRHNRELANKLDSETIWWLDPDQQVLALYQPETTGAPQGAVLLLADLGRHARWPGLQQTLREQLPWAGWHSLSIALPLAITEPADDETTAPAEPDTAEEAASEQEKDKEKANKEENPEASASENGKIKIISAPVELQLRAPLTAKATLEERQEVLFALLDSAQEQLKAKNIANQAVIAEGEALWWITYWLTERKPAEFGALIMLSPKTPQLEGAPRFNELLSKLAIKEQLDLIRMPNDSFEQSRLREAAARRQNQSYHRLNVAALNNEQLAKRLHSWLNRYMAGMKKTFR